MATEQTIIDAMVQLGRYQIQLIAAVEALMNHDTDTQAHKDIRQIITTLKNSERIWTNQQIVEICQNAIREHVETELEQAHGGIDRALERYVTSMHQFIERLEAIEQTQASIGDVVNTEALRRAVEEITNRYEPLIDHVEALEEWQAEESKKHYLLYSDIDDLVQNIDDRYMSMLENFKNGVNSTIRQFQEALNAFTPVLDRLANAVAALEEKTTLHDQQIAANQMEIKQAAYQDHISTAILSEKLLNAKQDALEAAIDSAQAYTAINSKSTAIDAQLAAILVEIARLTATHEADQESNARKLLRLSTQALESKTWEIEHTSDQLDDEYRLSEGLQHLISRLKLMATEQNLDISTLSLRLADIFEASFGR